jgi:dihydrofolate reductase
MPMSRERVGGLTFRRLLPMTKVVAGITTSVDGYITGPDDGPDKGLGEGGERLHQGLDAGIVDELHVIVAPVILGGGKRLFEDFTKSLDLENRGVRQSRWATFIEFAVKR